MIHGIFSKATPPERKNINKSFELVFDHLRFLLTNQEGRSWFEYNIYQFDRKIVVL